MTIEVPRLRQLLVSLTDWCESRTTGVNLYTQPINS